VPTVMTSDQTGQIVLEWCWASLGGVLTQCPVRVEIPIESGMGPGSSIRIDKFRVFINKTLSTQSLINQLLIKRVDLSISVDSR
jgi:hypothetical protein